MIAGGADSVRLDERAAQYTLRVGALVHIAGVAAALATPWIGCYNQTLDCRTRFLSLSRLTNSGLTYSLFAISALTVLHLAFFAQQFASGLYETRAHRVAMRALSLAACGCTAASFCFPLHMHSKFRNNMTHYSLTLVGYGLLEVWYTLFATCKPRLATWGFSVKKVGAVPLATLILVWIAGIGTVATLNVNLAFVVFECAFFLGLSFQHTLTLASVAETAQHLATTTYLRPPAVTTTLAKYRLIL